MKTTTEYALTISMVITLATALLVTIEKLVGSYNLDVLIKQLNLM